MRSAHYVQGLCAGRITRTSAASALVSDSVVHRAMKTRTVATLPQTRLAHAKLSIMAMAARRVAKRVHQQRNRTHHDSPDLRLRLIQFVVKARTFRAIRLEIFFLKENEVSNSVTVASLCRHKNLKRPNQHTCGRPPPHALEVCYHPRHATCSD